jgi:hypothetical protein
VFPVFSSFIDPISVGGNKNEVKNKDDIIVGDKRIHYVLAIYK